MTVLELLTKAESLIKNPNSWTQNSYARDSNGHPISIQDANACKFCAVGAIVRFDTGHELEIEAEHYLNLATSILHDDCVSVVRLNDYVGHRAVLEVYAKAKELAGENQAGCPS